MLKKKVKVFSNYRPTLPEWIYADCAKTHLGCFLQVKQQRRLLKVEIQQYGKTNVELTQP